MNQVPVVSGTVRLSAWFFINRNSVSLLHLRNKGPAIEIPKREGSKMDVWIPVMSAVIAALASFIVGVITARSQWSRLRAEFATEESAEAAIRHLLALSHLPYRSFPIIRHHLGGFESNELRQLLVRAGAVRFKAANGTELWALRERVKGEFQLSRWQHPDAPQNEVMPSELFPGAFNDPKEC